METKEKTCAERVWENMQERESELNQIYAVISGETPTPEDSEESETQRIDNAYDELNNFALGVDTVQFTTVCLSWGGPADYLEIKHNGAEIDSIIYRFSDWFDTATRQVERGTALWSYAQEIIDTREGAF